VPGAGNIVSISWPGSPGTLQIDGNTPVGTVYQFGCTIDNGSSCTNETWSFSNVPQFLTAGQNSTGGTLRTNASPIAQGGGSLLVSVTLSAPTVASITWPGSPGTLNIENVTTINTPYQFACTMSDNSSCVSRSWSYSNIPAFLTPSQNSTGLVLTTNQPPPLTIGSGSFQVQAQ
jgi:hypothetical protein